MPRTGDFWSLVAVGGPEECWPFKGHRVKGYGQLTVGGVPVYAHRHAWVLTYGPIPPEKPCVLHKCDNPPCVNPAHLWVGTIADNNADKARKGRVVTGFRGNNPKAKLSEQDVRAIRAAARAGSRVGRLASDYGVNRSTIRYVIQGRFWKHVA